MARNDRTVDVLLEKAGKWLPVLFGGVLLPWQDKLSGIQIVSDYYQPALSILTSVVAAGVTVALFAIYQGLAQFKIRRALVLSVAVFAVSVLALVGLTFSLGKIWHPIGIEMMFGRAALCICYSLTFISATAMALFSLMLLR